jgi:hypothetical protein
MSFRIICARRAKLPKIDEGLIIPKNGHFPEPESEEGELKVPAGISLQRPGD